MLGLKCGHVLSENFQKIWNTLFEFCSECDQKTLECPIFPIIYLLIIFNINKYIILWFLTAKISVLVHSISRNIFNRYFQQWKRRRIPVIYQNIHQWSSSCSGQGGGVAGGVAGGGTMLERCLQRTLPLCLLLVWVPGALLLLFSCAFM